MNINPDLVVSKKILEKEGGFTSFEIFEEVKEVLKDSFESENDILKFVNSKIKALYESRVVTFTGYSYYSNI